MLIHFKGQVLLDLGYCMPFFCRYGGKYSLVHNYFWSEHIFQDFPAESFAEKRICEKGSDPCEWETLVLETAR